MNQPTLTFVPVPSLTRTEAVPLDRIVPSRLNPRTSFNAEALEELAGSLRELGMIEPIVVREVRAHPGDGHDPDVPALEIVAGERRFRAARLLHDPPMTHVPVRNLGKIDDATALRIMLVENLQRTDLNPIEEAEGYAQLNRVAGMRQAEIAAAVHRTQPTIANRMRLLNLPDDVRDLIREGKLTASHGVALARIWEYPRIVSVWAAYAVKNGLSSARLELVPDNTVLEELKSKNLVRDLGDYRVKFQVDTICPQCPFGAYRKEWGWRPVCLKPSHFDELQAVGVAEEKAREAERLARFQERQAAGQVMAPTLRPTPPADPATVAPGDAPTVAPAADPIPQRRSLAYGTFEDVKDPPPGCTEACVCRSLVRDGAGGPIQPVCLDPARWRNLKRRETIAANKARKGHADALRTKIAAELALVETIGPAEATVLAYQIINVGVRADRVRAAWDELTQKAPAGDTKLDTLRDVAARTSQTMGADVAVLASVVRAVLGAELTLYWEGYYNAGAPLSQWYLDAKGARVDVDAIVTQARAEAALETADQEAAEEEPPSVCDLCGAEPTEDAPLERVTFDDDPLESGDLGWACVQCRRDEEERLAILAQDDEAAEEEEAEDAEAAG